jgi:PQQ-dependent catabolism-associated beta-propeller protein
MIVRLTVAMRRNSLTLKGRVPMKGPTRWLAAGVVACCSSYATAKGTGLVIVSNEKSSTLSVLDQSDKVVKTVKSCARPRGMRFSKDRKQFIVACGDDSTIAIYDVATLALQKRIRSTPHPETFDLHPDGRHIYVSNEDEARISVVDLETGEEGATFEVGEEPEGVLISPDGTRAYSASEASNTVHVIDIPGEKLIKDIVVGSRPRRLALTPDGKELWVSAEMGGSIDIIDTATLAPSGSIQPIPQGLRRADVTPVDIVMSRDGSRLYAALGRANAVAVIDVKARKVLDFLLVGKRPWGLALTADEKRLYVANGRSDDISIIDTVSNKVLKSIPVGQVPYGFHIDDQ